MSRKENNTRAWIAVGPKGGPYRVRVLEKSNSWFPSTNELENAKFYTSGIDVNKAIEELEV